MSARANKGAACEPVDDLPVNEVDPVLLLVEICRQIDVTLFSMVFFLPFSI